MTEALQILCARFVHSLGRAAEAEYFTDEDAWSAVEELAEMSARGERLGAAQQQALHNLGGGLGLRPGAPASRYLAALERYFGPCPLKSKDRDQVMEFVHAQMNGQFAAKVTEKVALRPTQPTTAHVALKNYEYK